MAESSISLSIGRANISTRLCSNPMCDERTNLHRVPLETRFNLMKTLRFFVGHNCLACREHSESNSWRRSDVEDINSNFNANHIHEMVDLLRVEPKSLRFDSPGKYYYKYAF